MNRHFVVAGILSSLLVCVHCNSSNGRVAFFESLKEEGSPHPLTLKQRLQTLTPVFDSFADALAKTASKYPEMAGYSRDKAINQSEDAISCGHSHNFTRPHVKRGILPSDFGENGFTISISCKAMPPPRRPYAMSPPALRLDNLQFYVWTEIGTGSNPSPGLLDEANAIIQSHLDKLTEADRTASNDPNKIQVVLEILDRPAFRAAMPPEKKITFEEYRKIKNNYISNNERWRSGFAFTYRTKEDDGWRGYWLALVSFDSKNAWIAELTQFHTRGWDWIALYNLDRCDEVDKDFVIARIEEERSKVVGGVQYGMSVADVIQLKGRHFKVSNHAEEGSADIVYDDIKITVRQWWAGSNTGRVVGVEATSNQTNEYMKNIPYEDEKSWYTEANGLRTQIVMKAAKVINETRIISTDLTLRNVSDVGNPMKLEWDSAKVTFRVVDEKGKELPRVTNVSYDGSICSVGILVLPFDSSLTFNISRVGLGIPKGKAALLDFGPDDSWIIDKANGKKYFLQATLEIKDTGRKRNERYWHGTIKIPKAEIPLNK